MKTKLTYEDLINEAREKGAIGLIDNVLLVKAGSRLAADAGVKSEFALIDELGDVFEVNDALDLKGCDTTSEFLTL